MKRKTTTAAKEAATTRKAPDFTGVPGELVSLDGLDLEFGAHVRRSPYDPLLAKLAESPKGTGLKFGDVKARVSVAARARKKGLRVSFAEKDGCLYVRLDGRVDDDIRAARRERIRAVLSSGPKSAGAILVALRNGGDATVDLPMVEIILSQMVRDGQVIRQEGGTYAWNNVRAAKAAGRG